MQIWNTIQYEFNKHIWIIVNTMVSCVTVVLVRSGYITVVFKLTMKKFKNIELQLVFNTLSGPQPTVIFIIN